MTTWPPGFKPQVNLPATGSKKAAAATKAREARAAKGVKAWGTNTTQEKKA